MIEWRSEINQKTTEGYNPVLWSFLLYRKGYVASKYENHDSYRAKKSLRGIALWRKGMMSQATRR